jgi:hypothetical protein
MMARAGKETGKYYSVSISGVHALYLHTSVLCTLHTSVLCTLHTSVLDTLRLSAYLY